MSPLKREILTALAAATAPMTNQAIYSACDSASSANAISKLMYSYENAATPMVAKSEGPNKAVVYTITDAGRLALVDEAITAPAPVKSARKPSGSKKRRLVARTEPVVDEQPEAEEAEERPVLDCAVWMSGDVSIIHGETNITLNADEANKIAGYLAQNLDSDSFARHVAQMVMNLLTAKLLNHPDDRTPASDPGVGFTESPFVPVDPGNNDQGVVVQPNKFDAFLRDSRADPALAQTETKRVPIGAEWLATLPARQPTEPTEATGLPGVEFDGPQGIHIPVFGQRPEAMTRADQFAETAARG